MILLRFIQQLRERGCSCLTGCGQGFMIVFGRSRRVGLISIKGHHISELIQQLLYFLCQLKLMCFFKGIADVKRPEMTMASPPKPITEDTSAQMFAESEFFSIPDIKSKSSGKLDINMMLLNCLGLANINSQIMFNMDQKLQQTQFILDDSSSLLASRPSVPQQSARHSSPLNQDSLERDEQNLFQTSDPLTKQLFGDAHYRYKLVVDGDFPEALYKERNFGLNVKLLDMESGKHLNNGNIVNICLGVCDDNGEWIHETKDGQTFMKGKIEAELYHGAGSFVKLAAKDVSRIYQSKTVNMVVYPKPTVLRYSGESSIEEHVDYSLIEPLVIHGISIKAKKRD